MRAATLVLSGAMALAAAAVCGSALAAQTSATPAAAQAPAAPAAAPAAPAASPDVTGCQGCHGANGISRNPRVPNLAGQQPAYLAAQLRAFRAGTRPSPVMQRIAAQFDDTAIEAQAHYWSSLPAGGGSGHDAH